MCSGIGVDEDGKPFSVVQRTWFYLAALVGSTAWDLVQSCADAIVQRGMRGIALSRATLRGNISLDP